MFPVISSLPRTTAFVLALAASLFVLALFAGPAAASPCGTRVLKEWSDNSRIDGTYQLHCYQDAIDALPSDLRDYSDALDVIGRAFRNAGGRHIAIAKGPQEQNESEIVPTNVANASSPSSLPLPLLVLGGVALTLLAAGGYGYVSRRRRPDDSAAE
jgi:hypothetical protein